MFNIKALEDYCCEQKKFFEDNEGQDTLEYRNGAINSYTDIILWLETTNTKE